MKSTAAVWILGLLSLIFGNSTASASALEAGALRVGTAKVDITPDDPTGLSSVYQTRFTGVHDRTYARAIILDNGVTSAAIISIDSVEVTDGTALVARISQETGIPSSNIIVAATHDHTAPMISLQNADGSSKAGPAAAAFVNKVEDEIVAAVKQARGNEQQGRIGIGHGTADVNINRDLLTHAGTYGLGRNPDGPSDKTVWVVKLESLRGEPIALLINYAVHSTVLLPKTSLISGELAGATSRFVENYYGGKVVAVWTIGAAGDQAPVVFGPDSEQPNAETNFAVVSVLGQILGTEAIRVSDEIEPTDEQIKLWGTEKRVTCPGQKLEKSAQEGPRKLLDADPVSFRLGLLMIDQIAVTSVSAEVVTNIYEQLRKESPFANTLMLTLANGRIGYIPQDVSYGNPTFEVYGSPLRAGCGESSILNGLMEMIKDY